MATKARGSALGAGDVGAGESLDAQGSLFDAPASLVRMSRPGARVDAGERVHHVDPWGSTGECIPVRGNDAPVTVAYLMIGGRLRCPKCSALVEA